MGKLPSVGNTVDVQKVTYTNDTCWKQSRLRLKNGRGRHRSGIPLGPNARYVYVYAVALNSTDKTEQAIMVLQGAHNRFPNNTDTLNALVAFHRDSGNTKAARTYADKLRSLSP